MEYYKPTDGPYYVCVKCNGIDYPIDVNLGNTHLIDLEYDKDVDKIVDRGRD